MYFDFKGHRVYCERTGNRKQGSIVFLHGWLASHKFFSFMKKSRLAENYELVFLDFLGFGNSDNPEDKELHTIESFAEQANSVLSGIGAENPIIVAHSMGGIVALEYAQKHKTKEIILFGPPLVAHWLHKLLVLLGRLGISRSMEAMVSKLKQKNFPQDVSKLKTQTTILYGEKDYWVNHDKDVLESLRKLKNVELIKLNCGHIAAWSRKKMFGVAIEDLILQKKFH